MSEAECGCRKNVKKESEVNILSSIPEKIVTGVIDNVVGFMRKKYGENLVNTNLIYWNYIESSYEVYGKVKTLINPYIPRIFEGKNGIYVPSKIVYNSQLRSSDRFDKKPKLKTIKNCEDLFRFEDCHHQCILILGSGGTGKSMLMRHLFLNAINTGFAIPILVNLRKYKGKDNSEFSIINLIYKSMLAFDIRMDQQQFFYSLRSGKYLILFDGLDEVKDRYRRDSAREIEQIYMKYSNNRYVITSRNVIKQNPHSKTGYCGESFAELKSFTFFDIAGLNLNNACSLVTKIGNADDIEKTEKFKKVLREYLWAEHKNFLSTPLLLSIMYITFLDRLDDMLMDNLADYYTNVFDVLYSKHELAKAEGCELRLLCEKLGYNKFKTLFSYICFHTFFSQQYEFTTEELTDLIRRGVKKLNYSDALPLNETNNFIQDLTNRVCLLVQEGTVFAFLHRSLQSYFAAFSDTTLCDKDQESLISRIVKEYYIQSDFISILAGIEKERFNKIYIYPVVSDIISDKKFLSNIMGIIKKIKISDPYEMDNSLIDIFIERFIPILVWLDCNYNADDFNLSENRILQILRIRDRLKNILMYYNYCRSVHNEKSAKEIMVQYLGSCRDALTKTKLLDVMEKWVDKRKDEEESNLESFISNL